MNSSILEKPLKLPCGFIIPNRIAKASLTEHLADSSGVPNDYHFNLYDIWARSGAGFLLTGNVMVDSRCIESYGNIVWEDDKYLDFYDQETYPQFQLWYI